MTDAVQAGRGLVDYPGVYPISTGYVLANISGNTALPYPVALADLAAAIGTPTYQGTWNASTNTPTLVSSVGVSGGYYVVSVAGTTNLNGITDWSVGDWAIFNGTTSTWQKIEGGATSLAVGSSVITGGTTTRILYDNAGTLGEYTIIGTGTVVAMQAGPTFTGITTFAAATNVDAGGNVNIAAGSGFQWIGRTAFASQADGLVRITNAAGTAGIRLDVATDNTLKILSTAGANTTAVQAGTLALGGATLGSNALAVTGTANISGILTLGAALNGVTNVNASGNLQAGAGSQVYFNNRSTIQSASDGVIALGNFNFNDFSRLQFGGTTSSFPALKRSGTTLATRLADDSAYTKFQAMLMTDTNATTGLTPGVLSATTNAYIVFYDGGGQAYRVPCII